MRTSRIYHPEPLQANQEIQLKSQAGIHLTRVLRCKEGDELVLFNGDGHEYPATITRLHRNTVWVTVISKNTTSKESPLNITLVQAISKGERMDYTIQKAVELGVTTIIPLVTARSINLKPDRIQKKLQHWRGIISSACEQCGRNIIPEIMTPSLLSQWLVDNENNSINIMLAPGAKTNLSSINYSQEKINLLIGAEGGLSTEEISLCQRNGLTAVNMGPRVLRTETAAITALSVIQFNWGDLR